MNLYILSQPGYGTTLNVDAYVRKLVSVQNSYNMNIYVVYLMSEKSQIQVEVIDGIYYWYFPSTIPEQRMISHEEQLELYYLVTKQTVLIFTCRMEG